jgi:hypothetical protein
MEDELGGAFAPISKLTKKPSIVESLKSTKKKSTYISFKKSSNTSQTQETQALIEELKVE